MAEQVSSLKTEIKYKDTPIGKIPVDWEVIPVDKICKIKRGASPRPIGDPSYFSESGRGWVRISDVTSTYKYLKKTTQYLSEEGVSKSVKVEPGNLIMSICATVGKPIIVDMKACIHDGFVFFSDLSKHVEKIYLFYFLQKNEKKISGKGQIGTQGNLNTDIVKKTLLPLPPFPEQKKIAEILTTVDDAIEKTIQIIAKIKESKKGLMQRLLTRGIGHQKFKKTEIGEIPEEWEVKRLGDLCVGKPEYGANVSAIDRNDRLPRYIRITDVTEDGKLSAATWQSIKQDDARSYILSNGDFLFARSGATVGKTYLYREKDGLSAFAGYMIRFRPNITLLLPEFLFHYTHSTFYYNWVKGILRAGAQPNINGQEYADMPIIKPAIGEQRQIVDILNSLDDDIEKEASHKEQLESLKKGLMQVLLTGKVRVNV